MEVIWHLAFRLVPYITSYSSRCRGISVNYSPSKDFNVSVVVTTSIFVASMAEIAQEAHGDQSEIIKYNLTEEQRSEIVKEIFGQSSSSRSFLHRKGRITVLVEHR